MAQTLESTGTAGNGIKVLQDNTKSSSGKTPFALRNTAPCPWKLSRPFGEYVVGHVWFSRAWDKETFRPLAGKEYPRARWLWPTITASRSPQTGQVTYKTKGPAVANWLACAKQSLPAPLAKISPIASLLEACLGILQISPTLDILGVCIWTPLDQQTCAVPPPGVHVDRPRKKTGRPL